MLGKCFMEGAMQRAVKSAYGAGGKRKYLTKLEGLAFIRLASRLDLSRRLLCEVLYFTGCRLSEALALTIGDVDVAQSTVLIRCLKKRDKVMTRRIPVPFSLARRLKVLAAQVDDGKLWSYSRTTGWRIIKCVMEQAGIMGIHATAKGLRHGFGVRGALGKVPMNVIQRWMGHSDPSTTAIYLAVHDDEERQLIKRTW